MFRRSSTPSHVRLTLESLGDRIVPDATPVLPTEPPPTDPSANTSPPTPTPSTSPTTTVAEADFRQLLLDALRAKEAALVAQIAALDAQIATKDGEIGVAKKIVDAIKSQVDDAKKASESATVDRDKARDILKRQNDAMNPPSAADIKWATDNISDLESASILKSGIYGGLVMAYVTASKEYDRLSGDKIKLLDQKNLLLDELANVRAAIRALEAGAGGQEADAGGAGDHGLGVYVGGP